MRTLLASVLVVAIVAPATPAHAQTAAPHILSRAEWGADESLLVKKPSAASSSSTRVETGDNGGGQPSPRQEECSKAYEDYPDEFKTSSSVTENANGQKLLWPQQYSPKVRMLVVHHTALPVATDTRSGVERMRALYHYHAVSLGWGDIGYHYVVDEDGYIYEGRAGGDSVVGGHAYCNNVGTLGIALMGNFQNERPTQEQIRSLQWLLRQLADKYGIDLKRNVVFHGKTLPPIIGHRDVLSTQCPGEYLAAVLDQIRVNVRSNNWNASVTFPTIVEPPPAVEAGETSGIKTNEEGLATLSETAIEGRPGAEIIIPVFFRADRRNYAKNTRIARLMIPSGMQVWQERDGEYVPARDVKIPVPLVKTGESVVLKIRVKLPLARGSTTLSIGSLRYTFELEGRSARGRQTINAAAGGSIVGRPVNPTRTTVVTRSSSTSARSSLSSTRTIRILLTNASETPRLTAGDPLMINGRRASTAGMNFSRTGSQCEAEDHTLGAVLKVTADGPISVNGERQYRGTIECRVYQGKLILINELSLEDYMAGLSEEPDAEPYQKQRAFAIAARTYALYYTDPLHRKFPGAPYDGSDNPATFQAYAGYGFASTNSEWARAVRSTSEQVLRYKGDLIRPPYFSSDDGRTRSPDEARWTNFPFAEIFNSKNDPWCSGMTLRGHGVGMSGCGAKGQANEGKTANQILSYYYPGTVIGK